MKEFYTKRMRRIRRNNYTKYKKKWERNNKINWIKKLKNLYKMPMYNINNCNQLEYKVEWKKKGILILSWVWIKRRFRILFRKFIKVYQNHRKEH